MTLPELAKRTDLVDKLAAYHVAPNAKVAAAKLKGNGTGVTYAVSGDPHYVLRFVTEGNKTTVLDAQGNKAGVTDADVDAGASVVHGVDKVLLSGGRPGCFLGGGGFGGRGFWGAQSLSGPGWGEGAVGGRGVGGAGALGGAVGEPRGG